MADVELLVVVYDEVKVADMLVLEEVLVSVDEYVSVVLDDVALEDVVNVLLALVELDDVVALVDAVTDDVEVELNVKLEDDVVLDVVEKVLV